MCVCVVFSFCCAACSVQLCVLTKHSRLNCLPIFFTVPDKLNTRSKRISGRWRRPNSQLAAIFYGDKLYYLGFRNTKKQSITNTNTRMADRNILSKATEQSSSPTPGYLYNDIAKQAASSPTVAAEIVSYLTRRLAKNNPHVKYKTLKTISMVCENPNSRGVFKRTVVMDHEAVKEIKNCINYRGKADAVHGDELYERVRNQAKETLDAIYSDEPSRQIGGGMQGLGSNTQYGQPPGAAGSYAGGIAAASSSSYSSSSAPSGPKKMEGIGNPMFKDPRLDTNVGKGIGDMTIGEVLHATKEGIIGIINDPLAKNIAPSHRPGHMGGRSNYGGSTSSGVSTKQYFWQMYSSFWENDSHFYLHLFPSVKNSGTVHHPVNHNCNLLLMDSGIWRPIVDQMP